MFDDHIARSNSLHSNLAEQVGALVVPISAWEGGNVTVKRAQKVTEYALLSQAVQRQLSSVIISQCEHFSTNNGVM